MKTAAIQEIIPRILRDMSDGVLVLDMQGNILYLNEQGQTLLGVEKDCTGLKYTAAFWQQDTDGQNDAFHQFVLDAVYDKEHAHSGEAPYTPYGREMRRFRLTSSFLFLYLPFIAYAAVKVVNRYCKVNTLSPIVIL